MPRKLHKEANFPPLPFEEWDFRTIQGDLVSLRVATQYEYLRSSSLRPAIERWQSQDISVLGRMALRMVVSTLQDLNLVDPRKRFAHDLDYSALLEQAEKPRSSKSASSARQKEYDRLHKAAEAEAEKQAERFATEPIAQCTINRFIGRLFRKIKDHGKLQWTLEWLKDSLPAEVEQRDAVDLALCFTDFSSPWVKLPRSYWPQRRFIFAPESWDPNDDADPLRPVRQLAHPMDVTSADGLLGVVPVHLVLNFNRTPDELTSDFRRWLASFHVGSQPGRRDFEGFLRSLAVYRLTQHQGLSAAQGIEAVDARRRGTPAGQWIGTLPVTSSIHQWSRWVGEAKTLLQGDFIRVIDAHFARGAAMRTPVDPRVL